MTVEQMRAALVREYPSYQFHDRSQYPDYQIRAIYRDKKPKIPKYQWVPVELVNRDGYPTMIVEYRQVG